MFWKIVQPEIRTTTLLKLSLVACSALISVGQAQQTNTASEPSVQQMTLPSVELTYLEQGEGDVVLFVHPQYTDHRLWEGQREAVAQDHRFIALDTRFHGTTIPWPEDTEAFAVENAIWYSNATQITEMAKFIRQLDVGPVHVVGASRGSSLALNLALQYPELVRSLVLDSPSILPGLVTDPEYFEAADQEDEN